MKLALAKIMKAVTVQPEEMPHGDSAEKKKRRQLLGRYLVHRILKTENSGSMASCVVGEFLRPTEHNAKSEEVRNASTKNKFASDTTTCPKNFYFQLLILLYCHLARLPYA